MRAIQLALHGTFFGFYLALAVKAETTWVSYLDILFASFFAYRLVAVATWERQHETES